jgi:hypothetical protein
MSQHLPPGPGYQPPAPTSPYAAAPGMRTNVMAIVALVLGLTVPVAGIIVGHIAMSQIKRTGEDGHGMALAGTIIGYVFTITILLFVVGYLLFFVAMFSTVLTTTTVT